MSEQNINDRKEAITKLKELAEEIDFCFFCTNVKSEQPDSTPMSVQEVDDEGSIWFLASLASTKCENIKTDNAIQLYFSSPKDFKFLAVVGDADLVRDEKRIDKYWNKMVEGWFEKGREDPNIILIRVKPQKAHYWDTKYHKLLSYALTFYSAITGNKSDQGLHGEINVPN